MRKTQAGSLLNSYSFCVTVGHSVGPLGPPLPLLVLSRSSPVPSWCFSLQSLLGTGSPYLRKLPLAFLPTCAPLTLLHGETGEPSHAVQACGPELYSQHPCKNAGSIDHGRPPEFYGRHHGEDHVH